MVVTLVVPDPPPIRTHPGRSADRHSPNAGPLARAGEAAISAAPSAFPIVFAGIVAVFGRSMPNVEGYELDHAIYEVLVDIGLLLEPEAWWTRHSRNPSADYYVVSFASNGSNRM